MSETKNVESVSTTRTSNKKGKPKYGKPVKEKGANYLELNGNFLEAANWNPLKKDLKSDDDLKNNYMTTVLTDEDKFNKLEKEALILKLTVIINKCGNLDDKDKVYKDDDVKPVPLCLKVDKCNNLTISNCRNLTVVVDSLITQLTVTNCYKLTLDCKVQCPLINMSSSQWTKIYLSRAIAFGTEDYAKLVEMRKIDTKVKTGDDKRCQIVTEHCTDSFVYVLSPLEETTDGLKKQQEMGEYALSNRISFKVGIEKSSKKQEKEEIEMEGEVISAGM